MGRKVSRKDPVKIDVIRQQRGMSVRELAEAAGVNKRSLEDLFQRRKKATNVYTLQKLARVLGCSIEELIEPIEETEED